MDSVETDDKASEPLRGAAKKEAYHRAREKKVKPFSFVRPDGIDTTRKAFVDIVKDDNTEVYVQIINDGGDNNLHYHPNMNSVFYVLKGRVKIYGPDDLLYKDCGVNDGVYMPADTRYWFEVTGDEEAWLLHVVTLPKGRKMTKRINVDAPKPASGKSAHFDVDSLQEIFRPERPQSG
jgi:mannose-6-phosphate isomerase-like protein (cupin superfamily)